jgi:hypothetical protein
MPGTYDAEVSPEGYSAQTLTGEQFHCPACSFGPDDAEEVLVHIITNHEIEG